jgi:hypothetical protein
MVAHPDTVKGQLADLPLGPIEVRAAPASPPPSKAAPAPAAAPAKSPPAKSAPKGQKARPPGGAAPRAGR